MKCPLCGCEEFFVRDPADEFETYEFSLAKDSVEFAAGTDAAGAPAVGEDTETFCNRCSWHGRLDELKGDRTP
jgi:hypothetical protein